MATTAWYETAEDDGSWDTRTNTLTFHTFRPTSPDDLTAVSGVTPQMFNGTLERMRQHPRQASVDPDFIQRQHQFENNHPRIPHQQHRRQSSGTTVNGGAGLPCQLDPPLAYRNPPALRPVHPNSMLGYRDFQTNGNHAVAYVQPYFYNSQRLPPPRFAHPQPAMVAAGRNGCVRKPPEYKPPPMPVNGHRPNGILVNGKGQAKEADTPLINQPPSKSESVSFRCAPKVLRNYQELLVDVSLSTNENVAGFSMTSAVDRGNKAPLHIFRVMQGSPADRAGLDIKDEILEINGESVVNCNHDEVIELIQKSIKTKTVQLKVRRKLNDDHISTSIPSRHNSTSVSSSAGDSDSVFREDTATVRTDGDGNSKNQYIPEKAPEIKHRVPADQRHISDAYVVVSDPDDRETLIKDISRRFPNARTVDMMHTTQQPPQLAVESPIVGVPNGKPNGVAKLGQNGNAVAVAANSPTNGQLHFAQPHTQRHNHQHHHNNNHPQTTTTVVQQPHTNGNGGNFVAVPNGSGLQRHEEQETSFIVGDGDTAVLVKNSSLSTAGQPTTVVSVGQYYGGSKTSLATRATVAGGHGGPGGGADEPDTDQRLKRYESDLQKRREVEDQRAKEEEFLRSSIRGSKKLQALAKTARSAANGHSNDAYEQFRDNDDDEYYEEEQDENSNPQMANGRASTVQQQQNGGLALDDVLMSVNRLTGALDRSPEFRDQSQFIRDLFNDQSIRNAIEVTAIAQEQWGTRAVANTKPIKPDALGVVDSLLTQLDQSNSTVASEFRSIVETPLFQALLYTHDKTAEKLCETEAGPSRNGFDDKYHGCGLKETQFDCGAAGDLRIVKLIKTGDNPLGATVVQEGKNIVIGRVIKGGVAEKSGLLREGDELLEVNGVDLRSKSVHEVCTILADMQGELTFVVLPSVNGYASADEAMPVVKHMRALFDYDPEDDSYLPCRELGLSFHKGDILHVISMTDPNWWQAHRDGEENCQLAGLVPSSSFHAQKERYKLEITGNGRRSVKGRQKTKITDRGGSESSSGGFWCAKRRSKPKSKSTTIVFGKNGTAATNPQRWSTSAVNENGNGKKHEDDDDAEEDETDGTDLDNILTYEEAALYLSKAGTRRPVVLVGPTHVGCLQLRQKLMEMEKEKFAGAVPHTSRPRKADEQDAVHYHFVTRQQFQEGVAARKFVEWGEYQKHFYGTSFDAIRRVIERGKTCVLTLKPQNLKALRNSDLMPFVVFISPPSFERLKANKLRESGASVKEDDLKNIINEAKVMENDFGHFFDKIIVNYDLERSFQELRTDIHRLETEPQWVNAEWIRRQQRQTNGTSNGSAYPYSNRTDHGDR